MKIHGKTLSIFTVIRCSKFMKTKYGFGWHYKWIEPNQSRGIGYKNSYDNATPPFGQSFGHSFGHSLWTLVRTLIWTRIWTFIGTLIWPEQTSVQMSVQMRVHIKVPISIQMNVRVRSPDIMLMFLWSYLWKTIFWKILYWVYKSCWENSFEKWLRLVNSNIRK